MSQKKNICVESRSRRWCLTLNHYTEAELDKLSSLPCRYIVYGLETGQEGTPHVQGYIVFKNARRFSTLKKFLPRGHWEIAQGSDAQNVNYCKKQDPNPYERGSLPIQRANANVNPQEILARDPINGPRILNVNRQLNGYQLEYSMLCEVERGKLKKPKIIYVYGSSGSGKSFYALKRGITEYGKENICTIRFDRSGFAHCSNPLAECLVMMEFRPSCLDAVTFLELTDGYGLHLNIKHGSIYIRPKCLFICSILPPTEIYKEEINRQFVRRLTEIINKDLDPWVDRTSDSDSEGSTIELDSDIE